MCLKCWSIKNSMAIISLVVNTGLAIWIITVLQRKLANKRVLKDFFIDEVKDLRKDYRDLIFQIMSGERYSSKDIKSNFKALGTKETHLLDVLDKNYGVRKDILNPYSIELRLAVSEDERFISTYKNKYAKVDTDLYQIEKENAKCFYDIILAINNK